MMESKIVMVRKHDGVHQRFMALDGLRLELEFNSLDAQRDASNAHIKSQPPRRLELSVRKYDDDGFSDGIVGDSGDSGVA